MCDRYFIEFPPQEPLTPESLLEASLALVYPKDIQLHKQVFLMPFEDVSEEKPEKKRIWSKSHRKADNDAGAVLRRNMRFMIRKTKHFGLLLSQLTWVGLLNFAEKRRVLQQSEDNLRAAALYIIMLKKEANLTQFINCLHMTGNHEIANIIEAKLELLEYSDGNCEHYGQCNSFEASMGEWKRHGLPPKKRKTSADSGFDDTDDEEDEIESSTAVGPRASGGGRKYRCNFRPLDAVDVIAIINGKEDSLYKVELCKCGHYHQFPKWKDVSKPGTVTKENTACNRSTCSMSASTTTGLAKYFTRSRSDSSFNNSQQFPQKPKQGILSPVVQPVEVGSDVSHDHDSENMEYTQPRRSCSHLRLRFSNTDSFAEHPGSLEEQDVAQGESDGSDDGLKFKDKLPRFFRAFL